MRRRVVYLTLSTAVLMAGVPGEGSAQEATRATVSRVIEGDTLEATDERGGVHTVRLIGIDTPDGTECAAREAAGALRALVEGQPVTLTTDPNQDRTDGLGRLLAYVDTETIDAGREMIRRGWSDVDLYDNRPFARQSSYVEARNEASAADRGVWRLCAGDFHQPAAPAVPFDHRESAEGFVRSFYQRVTRRRFRQAWRMLSARLRSQFGSYSRWRAGYRRSLGTRLNLARARWNGSVGVVTVAIRARDRDACSGRVIRQFFRGRWTLARRGGQWRASRIRMRKVGGGNVRVFKSQCAPKPRPRPRRRRSGGGGGGGGCHPSYRPCVPAGRGDLDCPDIGHPVQVVGPDEYRLDGDNDGEGCES